jgi:hypothetical protein
MSFEESLLGLISMKVMALGFKKITLGEKIISER